VDRRQFLRRVIAGNSAVAAVGTDARLRGAPEQAETAFDVAAANRRLADHRIAAIKSRRMIDRFPRSVGPNSKGHPVGRGGSSQARIITTDQSITGWCMGGGHQIDAGPFIGAKIGDMFDVGHGKADDVPWWLDKTLHDPG